MNSSWVIHDNLLLLTPDAQTYYETGREFLTSHYEGESLIRPFLYSVLLYGFHSIGGATLVVFFQMACWVLVGNIIYFTSKSYLKSRAYGIVCMTTFMLNLSLMVYIFHGLTELFSTLLLSLLVYLVLSVKGKFQAHNLIKITLVLALLAVTKPLFYYPFLFFLVFTIFYLVWYKLATSRKLIYLFLAISPVIFQVTFMKVKHNVLKVSTIDDLTFNNYLFAQGLREIEAIDSIELSHAIARTYSGSEKLSYIWENKSTYYSLYINNLWTNIDTDESNFLMSPSKSSKKFADFMDDYNHYLYVLSKWMLLVFLIFFVIDFFKKHLKNHWKMYFIGTILYYIAFSSGISFWQGDRLTIFAIPLWIVLYAIMLQRLWSIFRNVRGQKVAN